MINIIEKNEIKPLCPHCKATLSDIFSQQIYGVFGKRYIYFCPNCNSVLGVSHRKGFWMG